jgi:DNA polymerase III subunit epsilon
MMPVYVATGKKVTNSYSKEAALIERAIVKAENEDDAREAARSELALRFQSPVKILDVAPIGVSCKEARHVGLVLDTPWYEQRLVAFDIETTGFGRDNRIIQFGWAEYDRETRSFKKVDEFFVNSEGVKNEGRAAEVNKIAQSDIDAAQTLAELADKIRAAFDGAIVMAHNASFDVEFVLRELARVGVEITVPPFICTKELSMRTPVGQKSNKLEDVSAHFGIDAGVAHQAGDDAATCGNVFLKLARANESLRACRTTREFLSFFDMP